MSVKLEMVRLPCCMGAGVAALRLLSRCFARTMFRFAQLLSRLFTGGLSRFLARWLRWLLTRRLRWLLTRRLSRLLAGRLSRLSAGSDRHDLPANLSFRILVRMHVHIDISGFYGL